MIGRKKTNVGIVGCGRVAEYHLKHLAARADVQIVALADANLDAARSLASRFSIPQAFSTLDELLTHAPIDVLHVLTPPESHKGLALMAIERGVHVLVEKPLALSVDDVREILARAAEKGVMVVPDFIQLFHPRMVQATELIESGRLGRVLSVECHIALELNMPELREARGLHWSYTLPGGVLQNYVTHPLYLAMHWTGAPRRINVASRNHGALPQGLTDQVDILIDGEKTSGHVTVSLAAQSGPYSVRILCEAGTVLVDFISLSMLTTTIGVLPRSLARILPLQAAPMVRWTVRNVWDTLRKRLLPYHGLKILFDRLYEAVAAGGPPPVSPELSLWVAQAEHAVATQAAKVHVDTQPRASTQRGIARRERVLVTGAAGYVGRRVVARLVADGYYVRALARPLSQIAELERLGVEIQFADLRDDAAVSRAAEGMDVIVHVGAAIRGSAGFMRDSTVSGTRNVATAAQSQGVRRVIYISSMAVYDFASIRNARITADSPLEKRPEDRGVASAVKREAEDIALEEARRGTWTIIRPSLIFGGGRDPLGMLGPRRGGMVICLGRPGTRLRLVHVDDVASAVSLTIRTPESAGRVLTLSHPETLTYREYFRSLPVEITKDIRPVYLRRWFVATAALGLRMLNRLRRRSGGLSRRQVGYLYSDALVDCTPLHDLGWQPSQSLRDQVSGAQIR